MTILVVYSLFSVAAFSLEENMKSATKILIRILFVVNSRYIGRQLTKSQNFFSATYTIVFFTCYFSFVTFFYMLFSIIINY